jgi:hypothetical protein
MDIAALAIDTAAVAMDTAPAPAPAPAGPRKTGGDSDGQDILERVSQPGEGWWTEYGFASLGDYLREVDAGWERIGWSRKRRRKRSDLPAPDAPSGGELPPPSRRLGDQQGRQVGIRLDAHGYQALCEAARIYGVAPSTMARLLVHKGALKIVNDQPDREADAA